MRALSCARTVAYVLVVLAMHLGLARPSWGQPHLAESESDPRKRAEALVEQAEQEEATFAFAQALAHYEEARTLDPGGRRAGRAESRAAELRAHAEGAFAPLTELEGVRRDPARSSDAGVIDELVRHADTFPPGLVRVEAWVLAAEAYERRLGRPADADALLGRIILDPRADPITASKAARDRVTFRLERGELAGAEEAVREAGGRADPGLGRLVRRLIRRGRVHTASIWAMVALGLLAGRAVATALRAGRGGVVGRALARAFWLVVGYAAYVGVAGALLATGYEQGTGRPFLVLGLVLVPIVLLARAWAAAGGVSAAARAGRAATCAVAAMGCAFLVLEGVNAAFLEGMGL